MSNGKNPLMLLMAISVPGAAHALGLGDIHVSSALNERLSADIDIVGATTVELNGLRASVASRELFTRQGFERPAFLSSMTFKVAQDAQGRPVLSMRSTEAFNEPLVNVVIDVHWGTGELVREYTLLLDPAELRTPGVPDDAKRADTSQASDNAVAGAPLRSASPAANEIAAAASGDSGRGQGAPQGGMAADQQELRAHPARTMTHTKVGPRATLRGIAWRIGERNERDMQRMMIALFRANPSAFEGNINLLHLGATLAIPSDEAIEMISHADASREVHAQMAAWRAAAPARAARLAAHGGVGASHAAQASQDPRVSPATPTATNSGGSSTSTTAPAAPAPQVAQAAQPASATPVTAPAVAADDSNEALTRRIQSLEQELHDMKSTLDQEREQMAAIEAYAARLEQTRQSAATAPAAAVPAAAAPTATAAATAAAAPTAESHGTGWMVGGFGALAAALAAIYLKLRRKTDSSDDPSAHDAPRYSQTPGAAPVTSRDGTPTRSSYEVVETLPLKALTDPSLDATSKLDQLGIGDIEDSHRVEAILEGNADDATHRLPSVPPAGRAAAGRNEPTARLQSLDARNDATVKMQPAMGSRGDANMSMSLRADPSELQLADEVDMTAQHHVHMPSELTESAAFKERRMNPIEVLEKAIEREPDRDDLRLKLLELHYSNAAQNQQAFLQALEKFAGERGTMPKEQWEKIAAMGRQIAAANPLFNAAGAEPKTAAQGQSPSDAAAPSSDPKIAYFRR